MSNKKSGAWAFIKQRRISEFKSEITFSAICGIPFLLGAEGGQNIFNQIAAAVIVLGVFIYRFRELWRREQSETPDRKR